MPLCGRSFGELNVLGIVFNFSAYRGKIAIDCSTIDTHLSQVDLYFQRSLRFNLDDGQSFSVYGRVHWFNNTAVFVCTERMNSMPTGLRHNTLAVPSGREDNDCRLVRNEILVVQLQRERLVVQYRPIELAAIVDVHCRGWRVHLVHCEE